MYYSHILIFKYPHNHLHLKYQKAEKKEDILYQFELRRMKTCKIRGRIGIKAGMGV